MMKNTVIFGGTFNPPHLGHLQMLRAVAELETTKKVIVIPTSVPPHKVCKNLAGNEDRLNMCRLAFENEKGVFVSDIEMRRNGKSFTYDTLNSLANAGEKDLAIVCGGDMITSFFEWYHYEDILKMAKIIAFCREGTDSVEFYESVDKLKKLGGNIEVITRDIVGISSTQIRNNIDNSKFLLENLPRGVYDYIIEKGIYNEL